MESGPSDPQSLQTSSTTNYRFSGLFNFFRSEGVQTTTPSVPASASTPTRKQAKIYQRSQTLKSNESSTPDSEVSSKSKVTAGNELDDPEGVMAPPRTTFFESAGDLLNPKLPSIEYLIDPSKRPRTIFHDRVYHPEDIPPPPLKKRATSSMALLRKGTGRTDSSTSTQKTGSTISSPTAPMAASPQPDPAILRRDDSNALRAGAGEDSHSEVVDGSQMKVEEKIARAYHRDLSWRKVLVKLEPDAHNNIIVRRMFANAYGWPVVHHLVEAHFSDSATARTRDDDEPSGERAKRLEEPTDTNGAETRTQVPGSKHSGSMTGDGTADDAKGSEESAASASAAAAAAATEANEALDAVPCLPGELSKQRSDENALGVMFPPSSSTPSSPSSLRALGRPRIERIDSVTWSEQDWVDSGDESCENVGDVEQRRGKNHVESEKGKDSSWNWTEKIVGKGGVSRSRSPSNPVSSAPELPLKAVGGSGENQPATVGDDKAQREEIVVVGSPDTAEPHI